MSALSTPVLEVADLAVSFDNSAGGPRIQAVNGVNMTLFRSLEDGAGCLAHQWAAFRSLGSIASRMASPSRL